MRNRTTRATLGSLVMVFESVVVFFATLVGFGLRVHPDPAVIWGVGVGLSVILMLFPAVLGKPGTYADNCCAAWNLGSFDVSIGDNILRNVGLGNDRRCHN
jgi:hypothetical protein